MQEQKIRPCQQYNTIRFSTAGMNNSLAALTKSKPSARGPVMLTWHWDGTHRMDDKGPFRWPLSAFGTSPFLWGDYIVIFLFDDSHKKFF